LRRKPADRLRLKRHLAHGVEREFLRGRCAALGCRIEIADAFERIAKEIQPHRLLGTGNENIEYAAAHGEFANFAHRVDTLEALAGPAAPTALPFSAGCPPARKIRDPTRPSWAAPAAASH
jgi:hypothetical protein